MRTVLVLAAIVLLGGCVSLPNGATVDDQAAGSAGAFVPPIPDFDWATVVDPDHAGHQLPELHTAGSGLSLVGHASVQDVLGPTTRGSITQVDVWHDHAVVSGMEGGLAFVILDIRDPAAPKPVSWWPSAADGWTARFSDDGNFVFYGCQFLAPTIPPGGVPPYSVAYNPPQHVKGTCEDPDALHAPPASPSGVVVVDVHDKAHPEFVDFLETAGSHNIFTTSVDGVDYIFTAATTILRFDREARELQLLAEVPGVHDATAARHPVTGQLLLFTGAKDRSFAIYDITEPGVPEVVYEGGLEGVVGWHEQTLIPGLVDGRVVLAVGGETRNTSAGGPGVPDSVFFVDVTDPAAPTLLSEWKPPFEPRVPWVEYQYSIHEMAATPTGQLAIAWYHAGVWVLDVSTKERQATPAVLAAYQPHGSVNVLPSTFAQTPIPIVPFVWGVGWDARGYLVVPDMHTGVYVLEPEWGLHAAVDGGQ